MKNKKVIEKNEISVEDRFYFLRDLQYVKEPIEFLKSLNLTDDQYSKLSEIIDEYGTERYSEGESDEYSRNADADY